MGRPKLTLPWGATSVIGQVCQALLDGGSAGVIVVTGGAADEVRRALTGLPVVCAYNPDYAAGDMSVSLRVGLAAAPPDWKAGLVALGDQPQIQAGVVRTIIEVFQAEAAALIVPSYQQRRGHPWLAGRSLWTELAGLTPPATLRSFLAGHAAEIRYLEVGTPSILQDLDTPEDYQRYRP
jgi:molybdenum cofactor cytidylyltransferase